MTQNKTQPTSQTPEEFLSALDNKTADDGVRLLEIMRGATGEKGVMWGPSIIGFGTYHYKYASGREGDWMKVGFSPRASSLVLYGLVYYEENEPNNQLLDSLGKSRRGKGCLYIKSLNDIDVEVLKQMIHNSYMKGDYDGSRDS